MAVRRCFSGKITESDAFYELPGNAQALYLHLNMLADDDGFVNNAAGVAYRIFGGKEALKKLVERRFLLKFGDIYVIKHWKISNSLKTDRMKPLNYRAIADRIWVEPNRAYTDHPVEGGVNLLELRGDREDGFQNGFQFGKEWNPKIREDKIREDKIREEKGMEEKEWVEGWKRVCRAYPLEKLGDRESAYRVFCKVIGSGEELGVLEENLKQWKLSEQWEKAGGRYIPMLENFLRRGIWRGRPDRLAVPKGASGALGEAELEAIRKALEGQEV